MKSLFVFMSLFLVIGLTSCQKSVKEKIVGKWLLTEVDGEKAPADAEDVFMEFNEDGTVGNSRIDKKAKWEMVDDETIKIIDENDETILHIIEVTDKILKVKDDDGAVVVMEKR